MRADMHQEARRGAAPTGKQQEARRAPGSGSGAGSGPTGKQQEAWRGAAPTGKQTSRASAKALIDSGDVRAPALAKRCEMVGVADALSPLAETPLGRARLLGIITEGQYRAGVQYEAVVQLWRVVQGLGPGRVVAIDMMGVAGRSLSGTGFTDAQARAVTRRHEAACRALNRATGSLGGGSPGAGRAVVLVVNAVLFEARPVSDETLHALRTGLNALARHFDQGHRPNRVLVWNPEGRVSMDPAFWDGPPAEKGDSEMGRNRASVTPTDIAGGTARKA